MISAPESGPPFELRRPRINAQLPTLLDHAAVSLRHPPRRAIAPIAAASVSGLPSGTRRSRASPRSSPRRSWLPRPSPAPTCSRSTGSVAAAYLAQSPQFYKQTMVGVFERVYEVGPCSAPSPTTPPATSPSTCRSTPRWASSPTTATSWPYSRTFSAGMLHRSRAAACSR